MGVKKKDAGRSCITPTEDTPSVRVVDSGGLWFCLVDLYKGIDQDAMWEDLSNRGVGSGDMKPFYSEYSWGRRPEYYVHQSTLYKLLISNYSMLGFSSSRELYSVLMLEASARCYSGTPIGVPVLVRRVSSTIYRKSKNRTLPDKFVFVKDVAAAMGMTVDAFRQDKTIGARLTPSAFGLLTHIESLPHSVRDCYHKFIEKREEV